MKLSRTRFSDLVAPSWARLADERRPALPINPGGCADCLPLGVCRIPDACRCSASRRPPVSGCLSAHLARRRPLCSRALAQGTRRYLRRPPRSSSPRVMCLALTRRRVRSGSGLSSFLRRRQIIFAVSAFWRCLPRPLPSARRAQRLLLWIWCFCLLLVSPTTKQCRSSLPGLHAHRRFRVLYRDAASSVCQALHRPRICIAACSEVARFRRCLSGLELELDNQNQFALCQNGLTFDLSKGIQGSRFVPG